MLAGVNTFNLIGDAKCALIFGPFVAGIKPMERSPGLDPSAFHSKKAKIFQAPFASLQTVPVRPRRISRRNKEILELTDSEDENEPHEEHKVRNHPSKSCSSHIEQHLIALFCLALPVRLRYPTNCHWKQGILF
jgi:hypothetical protein